MGDPFTQSLTDSQTVFELGMSGEWRKYRFAWKTESSGAPGVQFTIPQAACWPCSYED